MYRCLCWIHHVLQLFQLWNQPVPCLYGNRSCLGCCVKSFDASRGLRIHGQYVGNSCVSDDFWSTSTCDLDNSYTAALLQTQKSFSSISVPNLSQILSSGGGGTSNHSEFVNHGLKLWNQSRAQWCGANKKPRSNGKVKEPVLSWNASYDFHLLSSSRQFRQPVPLSEMVDFLVDIWDQEGMYD